MKPFIDAGEVQELLGVNENKAYGIIRDINKELEAKGFYTMRGKVNRDYFYERFGLSREKGKDSQWK